MTADEVSLIHFIKSIQGASASWADDSDMAKMFDKFGGDVVQSVQALKESAPDRTTDLQASLQDLLRSFYQNQQYCQEHGLSYPFKRPERQVKDVVTYLFPESVESQRTSGTRPSLDLALLPLPSLETFAIGPYNMPRLFNGFWQLSSPAWGSGSATEQENALLRLVEAGLVAADMADHYGDAELIYGEFRNKLRADLRSKIYAATKWCIFKPLKQPVTTEWVLAAVRERCRRLGGRVELLQFHWYDYESKEYLDILAKLVGITKSHPNLVSTIGLCNFDSNHTEEVCQYLQENLGEVGIVSNQVQFSLFDARPLKKMMAVCDKYGLKLLTYGSFCGGFLSNRWLNQPVPEIYSDTSPLTPSQRKYLDMILTWGTWNEFQALLTSLSDIATKHEVSLTNVATRWVLQQNAVGAVIVGTRLGVSNRGEENLKAFGWGLNEEDILKINKLALGSAGSKVDGVFAKLGDCGNEYRAMH